MSAITDTLSLLLMIRRWVNQIDKTTALLQKMRDEDRDTLTAEEWETLQAADDVAREDLINAIAAAEG